MNKKGFIFLEIVFGIFMLGIIFLISFNLLNLTSKYFELAQESIEIDYIVESIMEGLKSKDVENQNFLNRLSSDIDLDYPLPIEYSDRYVCKILLEEENDFLWCYKLRVYKKLDEGRGIYEEFQASIPK